MLSLFNDNDGVCESVGRAGLRSSQEFHQVRLRDDARDLALRGHEDGVVVSQQARGELDRGLRVDLRERRLHDLVHPDPREILRVFSGQDEVVDHLVRDRADRVPVVHDGHLRELPVAHLVHGGGERDLRLDVLDLPRLDLFDERLLLLPLQKKKKKKKKKKKTKKKKKKNKNNKKKNKNHTPHK